MKRKRLFVFIIIIIFLGLLAVYWPKLTGEDWKGEDYEKQECFVNRVIDGDTLVCNNETIRLLGIDNKEV